MLLEVSHKHMLKAASFLLLLAAGLYFNTADAATVNVANMIENFSKTVPNFMRLVTALAYVMGMVFMIRGTIGLKHFGEGRTHYSAAPGIAGPLVKLGIGVALLYLPSSVQVGISTFWQNSSPLAYQAETADNWSEFIQDLFMVVELVGTIAFIRGLIMLSHVGGNSQPGTMGKAMTHIIGGIFCINMYQFIQTVINTLALGQI